MKKGNVGKGIEISITNLRLTEILSTAMILSLNLEFAKEMAGKFKKSV